MARSKLEGNFLSCKMEYLVNLFNVEDYDIV